MSLAVDSPLVCPVTVGRDAQLAIIDQLLARAAAGQGQTVLITGEAGIGKSRLVAETRSLAMRRGMAVLEGHAFEGDQAAPFAPIVDLLRGYLNAHPALDTAAVLGPAAPGLARLLPAVAAWLPPELASASSDSEHERQRLLQAVLLAFDRLVEQAPTLLVFEDIHWSDEASLDVLRRLARSAQGRGLLVLMTLRTEDAAGGVAELRSTLDRTRLAVELPLEPLTRAEVDTMVRAIVGPSAPMRSEVLDTIAEFTEGSPFFVEEVLRTLAAGGDVLGKSGVVRVPRSVRDAVQRRVHRLSEPARQALRLAAVAGLRFDWRLLAELLPLDESSLTEMVRELVAAHLVVEVADDKFAFRHALTRQAVYGELLGRERRALHQRVLETMQRDHTDELLEELAYHAHAAGAWALAIEYGIRAGERALSVHAPRAAVKQFERVFQAAAELGQAVPIEVVRARGRAFDILGNFPAALADYETVLFRASALSERRLVWQILIDLNLLWSRHDYARAGDYAQRSLEVARDLDDPRCIGGSLNRVGNWHMNVGRVRAAIEHQEAALRLLESSGDDRGVAETLHLLGMTSAFVDSDQSVDYYDRALPRLRQLNDRQALVTDLVMRTIQASFYWADSLAPARRDPDQAEGDAAEALWLGPRGAYRKALQFARAGLAIAEEIEHRQWTAGALCSVGAINLDILNPAQARAQLERAVDLARALGSAVWIPYSAACLARAYVQQRDFRRAETLVEEVHGANPGMETITERHLWCARADLAFARHGWPAALKIAQQLAATLPPGRVAPRLWILRGEALAGSGSFEEAEHVLRTAAKEATDLGIPSQWWRAEAALARVLRSLNRRDEAESHMQTARSTIDVLAAELDDAETREHLSRMRASGSQPPGPRDSERSASNSRA